jgi:hypothetical protein
MADRITTAPPRGTAGQAFTGGLPAGHDGGPPGATPTVAVRFVGGPRAGQRTVLPAPPPAVIDLGGSRSYRLDPQVDGHCYGYHIGSPVPDLKPDPEPAAEVVHVRPAPRRTTTRGRKRTA